MQDPFSLRHLLISVKAKLSLVIDWLIQYVPVFETSLVLQCSIFIFALSSHFVIQKVCLSLLDPSFQVYNQIKVTFQVFSNYKWNLCRSWILKIWGSRTSTSCWSQLPRILADFLHLLSWLSGIVTISHIYQYYLPCNYSGKLQKNLLFVIIR
jgi:hypothetical protein